MYRGVAFIKINTELFLQINMEFTIWLQERATLYVAVLLQQTMYKEFLAIRYYFFTVTHEYETMLMLVFRKFLIIISHKP